MPAPAMEMIVQPDIVTAAIKLLAWAVLATGSALIAVLAWIWNKTDSKVDRIASSLELLTLNTSTDIATIKATCKANHPS